MRIGLVADDLTGACDSAVAFLRAGSVVVSLWPRLPRRGEGDCLAVSTETRADVPPEEARTRARLAVAHLLAEGAALVFNKVDSRLRGPVREELEGVLEAWPGEVVLAPALPGEGRVTRAGVQVTPSEEIDLGALTAGLVRVTVRDAATDENLDSVAADVLAAGALPAGTAGLAAAIARRLAEGARRAELPRVSSPLIVAGSKTEVTAAQLEYAQAAGWKAVRRARGDAVELDGHDALFLTGGGTAAGVLAALGAEGIELAGEAAPRVPAGRLLGGRHAGLVVALKSGGFGDREVIDQALRRLCGRG